VFVERGMATPDGLQFVRDLRRSNLAAKAAPVIVLSDERTVAALREAQNAGVHEFLVRPFSAAHLIRRLDAICGDQRLWIDTSSYVGPERRRFNSADAPKASERRRAPVL